MPTYEYICNECGDRFDHFQSMSSPALSQRTDCDKRGCNVSRVISGGTGLIFKGSGFYLTDYKIYLEHFALNKNNEAPSFFKNPSGYYDQYLEKIQVHKNNKTKLERRRGR